MKIWTCESSPRNGSQNAWTRIINFNCAIRQNKFAIFSARTKLFPVGRDWWAWAKPGYITMTRRQSNNQRSGGIATHPALPPKNPSENSGGKFLASIFLWSSRHHPHWSYSKGPHYQLEVLFISAGANEGHFVGKTSREVHQGCLVLARQYPGSPGSWNPEETGLPVFPVSWSVTIFSESGPVGLPPVPWTEKQLKFLLFCPKLRSFLPRRPGWPEKNLNLLWVAYKS